VASEHLGAFERIRGERRFSSEESGETAIAALGRSAEFADEVDQIDERAIDRLCGRSVDPRKKRRLERMADDRTASGEIDKPSTRLLGDEGETSTRKLALRRIEAKREGAVGEFEAT
jgi:hypothetical protein